MNNLMKKFSFTKNESKVILFIIAVLITGFSIKYYKHIISNGSFTSYDFTKSDSEFIEKSRNANKKFSISETDTSKFGQEKDSNNFSGTILDINIAAKNDFVGLPGIGESIADKIITYREHKKGFKKIEELMNVSGIGKKKFEKIKNYIKAE